ncbi:MAG: hypothetical protein GY869_07575 [Planctomycetes bacterium]|nr:hypothetical protein [Planctomycetota bacterium]
MNLFDMLLFLFVGFVTYWVWCILNVIFDISFLWAIPIFILVLAFITQCVFPIIGVIVKYIIPSMPKCHTGKCKHERDYKCIEFTIEEEYVFVCQCGRKYHRRNHRYVEEILGDGTSRPSMEWKGAFSGWQPVEKEG